MNAILRIETVKLNSPGEDWYNKNDFLQQALKLVTRDLTVANFNYYMEDRDDDFRPITSIDTFTKQFKTWKIGLIEFMSTPQDNSNVLMAFDISKDGFDIIIDIAVDSDRTRTDLIAQYLQISKSIYRYFKDTALIGYRFGVEVYNIEFDRLKPLRLNGYWGISKVVDIASIQYHNESAVGRPPDVNKLKTLKLPRKVERIIEGDLVIIRWVQDFRDLANVSSMLFERDKWFAENFELQVDTNSYKK